MRGENSDVEIGPLGTATPESIGGDVKASSILNIGSGSMEVFSSATGLQVGLNAHTVADLVVLSIT